MTSKRHRDGVARVAAGMHRTGFPSALRNLLGVEMDPEQRFLPDAFRIDDANRLVTLWEIEAAHGLSERKMERVRSLRDRLGSIGWTLRLEVAGPNDRNGTEIDIDTGDLSDGEIRRLLDMMERQ